MRLPMVAFRAKRPTTSRLCRIFGADSPTMPKRKQGQVTSNLTPLASLDQISAKGHVYHASENLRSVKRRAHKVDAHRPPPQQTSHDARADSSNLDEQRGQWDDIGCELPATVEMSGDSEVAIEAHHARTRRSKYFVSTVSKRANGPPSQLTMI